MVSELSKAFLAAAELIASGEHKYICNTIGWLFFYEGEISESTYRYAKRIMRARLAPEAFYDDWVLMNHPEIYWATPEHLRDACAQAGRVAWCKALAEEFK